MKAAYRFHAPPTPVVDALAASVDDTNLRHRDPHDGL